MMMETQVCNLKFAKIFKKLKLKQSSLIYWFHPTILPDCVPWLVYNKVKKSNKNNQYFSAFTAIEIMNLLPPKIIIDRQTLWFTCTKNIDNKWEVGYSQSQGFVYGFVEDNNIIDALSKILQYVLEYKMM